MPSQTLRFCPKCLLTQQTRARETCPTCDVPLRPLIDDHGALSADFLAARGSCCDNGCRNCPYPDDGASNTKTCERCGAAFPCQPSHCWCEQVHLSPATLKWLGRAYRDCLCPACLADFSAQAAHCD